MRFEEFHPDDYLEVGWKHWAKEKFMEWIDYDGPEELDEAGRPTIYHSPAFKKYYHSFDKVRISLPGVLENAPPFDAVFCTCSTRAPKRLCSSTSSNRSRNSI